MMGMGQRPPPRPQMGPSPMTAGRPNPMAGFQGGGGGFKGAQPMAPWMRPPPPQMPPGGGAGVQVAQGQPPPGGWGSGGAPGYSPPGPQQAMPLLQAPMGMGGGAQGVGPNFGGYQGTPPWMGGGSQGAGAIPLGQIREPGMGGGGGGPMLSGLPDFEPYGAGAQGVDPNMIQPALHQMQGAMGGGMRPQRRFPGALGRGIMQAMAPPPQATPQAPYGGQQFRMW